MPWNLLLLPLLSGFVTLDWCLYTRLRAQRIEGNRLLLEGAFAGALLTMGVYLYVWVASRCEYTLPIQNLWLDIAPKNVEFLGTALIAFCVGPIGALLVNRFVKGNHKRLYSVKRYAIESAGEYLLGVLSEAAYRGYLVELTTTDRKAYATFIAVAPDLKPETFVVLLPVLIGYKDKDTVKITYIDERRWWLEVGSRPQVIIPIQNIESAQIVELEKVATTRTVS
jgi:hypothetical protein